MTAGPAYSVRLASHEDVGFLADVTIEATLAQGRLPEDLDEAAWRKRFGEWTEQQLRGEIAGSTTSVIVVDGEPVGRLRVTRSIGCIELSGIQLLPRFQRRGIGTAIIEGLKREATEAAIPLEIGVEKNNPNARRLYERLGCRKVAETEQEDRLQWRP